MELHCINCKTLLASYDTETKLYKLNKFSFEKLFSKRFDRFLEFPIKLHCKFHAQYPLTYNKNNTVGLKNIKCPHCKNRTLGVTHNNYLGIAINFETVQRSIEFGNMKIECPKCNTLYDLEILRTKGIDIHISNEPKEHNLVN